MEKSFLKIPMPVSGFSVDYRKSVSGQTKGFLHPLQKDIVLVGDSVTDHELHHNIVKVAVDPRGDG